MITSPYVLTTADRVEIHELPGRYGDAIDDRDWAKLDTVFTQDAVFDLTGVGSRVCNGLDDIKAFAGVGGRSSSYAHDDQRLCRIG